MNNGQHSPSLLDQVRRHEQQSADAAKKTYREILHRASEPRKGDAEALSEAARTLGKSSADIENDLQAIAAARLLASQLQDAEAVLIKARDLRYEMQLLQEQTQEYLDNMKRREAELSEASIHAEGAERIVLGNHDRLRKMIDSSDVLDSSMLPTVTVPPRKKTEREVKSEQERWANIKPRDAVNPIPPGRPRIGRHAPESEALESLEVG